MRPDPFLFLLLLVATVIGLWALLCFGWIVRYHWRRWRFRRADARRRRAAYGETLIDEIRLWIRQDEQR